MNAVAVRADHHQVRQPVRAWSVLLLVVASRAYRAFVISLVALALVPCLWSWSANLVRTGSMEPTISAGDVVLASTLPASDPVPLGRVMVFTSPETGRTTVHRAVARLGDGRYTTRGNANAHDDPMPVPRRDFHGIGRVLVPYVGLPLLWLLDRDLLWLLAWFVVTSLAFFFATRARWLDGGAGPTDGSPSSDGPGHPGGCGRPTAAPAPRALTRVHLSALCIVSLAAIAVPVTMSGGSAAAASHYTATTANAGDRWTMFVQPQGKLTDTGWTISKAGTGATGVAYSYGFTTDIGAMLSSVTMTVPAGTAGTPVVGSSSGLPAGGTWSLAGTLLTYSFAPTQVQAATVVTLAVGGMTNTPVAGVYSSVVTTYGTNTSGPALTVDTGQSGAVTVTQSLGQLGGAVWSASRTVVAASGVAYRYGFTTATGATLRLVTVTVPAGTAGSPAVGGVAGLPAGGAVSLAGTTLTYSFGAAFIPSGTSVSLTVSGITNTPTAGTYVTQITTNGSSAAVPVDNGLAGPLSFSPGTLAGPVWTISSGTTGATTVHFGYSFTTGSGATLRNVTMTVPPGTGGTPTVSSATGVPANGVASLTGTLLTYSFNATYVNPGTAVTIDIGGLTNSSTAGSYGTEITTNGTTVGGPSLPIDTGLAGPLTLAAGSLTSPSWSTSKGTTGASGVTYGYGFTTDTNAVLSSVTMTVPPGTAGTPALVSASGVPGNGTLTLSGTVLTYGFAPTRLNPGSAVSLTVSGITNTPTAGTYVTQITTNGSSAAVPVDNGLAGPLSFSPGTLAGPVWASSTTVAGATGATYTYSFTTGSGAMLTSVSMTVPTGTSGVPSTSSVTGVPGGGTWSLSGMTLRYSFAVIWLNPGTAVRLSVGGMTNTATPGSYTAELATNGSTTNGPSYPVDTGVTGPLALR